MQNNESIEKFRQIINSNLYDLTKGMHNLKPVIANAANENRKLNAAKKNFYLHILSLRYTTATNSYHRFDDADFDSIIRDIRSNLPAQIELFKKFREETKGISNEIQAEYAKYHRAGGWMSSFKKFAEQAQQVNYNLKNDIDDLIEILEGEQSLLNQIKDSSAFNISEKTNPKELKNTLINRLYLNFKGQDEKQVYYAKRFTELFVQEKNIYKKMARSFKTLNEDAQSFVNSIRSQRIANTEDARNIVFAASTFKVSGMIGLLGSILAIAGLANFMDPVAAFLTFSGLFVAGLTTALVTHPDYKNYSNEVMEKADQQVSLMRSEISKAINLIGKSSTTKMHMKKESKLEYAMAIEENN